VRPQGAHLPNIPGTNPDNPDIPDSKADFIMENDDYFASLCRKFWGTISKVLNPGAPGPIIATLHKNILKEAHI